MMKMMKLLLPICFLLLIVGGLGAHLLIKDREISSMENRALATANITPSLQEVTSGDWFKQIETYVSDQFPYRDEWMKAYVEAQMLTGKTLIDNRYYVDKNTGWIIPKPAPLVEEEKLDAFVKDVSDLNEGLKNENIPFTLYALPAKATYVREPSPSYIGKDEGIANGERLQNKLVEANVDSVVLYDEIKDEFNPQEMFFKTDHHWNMRGAYLGYEGLIRNLSKKLNESIKPIPYDEKNTSCIANPFAGSWNKILYMTVEDNDSICYNNPASFESQFTVYKGNVQTGEKFTFDEMYGAAKNEDPTTLVSYGQAYSNEYAEVNIINNSSDNDLHLVVIKDSYLSPISFHVASHFKQLTILDLRYFEQDALTYIKKIRPDYTIVTFNDRNFDLYLKE